MEKGDPTRVQGRVHYQYLQTERTLVTTIMTVGVSIYFHQAELFSVMFSSTLTDAFHDCDDFILIRQTIHSKMVAKQNNSGDIFAR